MDSTADLTCVWCIAAGHYDNPAHFLRDAPVNDRLLGRPVHTQCHREAQRAISNFSDAVRREDGAWTWKSNGVVPFADVLGIWLEFGRISQEDFDRSVATRAEDLAAFLDVYGRLQPAQPSAEERAEMVAAFGEGAKIVDVASGREIQL